MRQQYHHRKIGSDTHVWDVNKIVEQLAALPVCAVALSDIEELDEAFWFGEDNGPAPTCRNIALHAKLIAEVDLRYPVILCPQGRVIDGMHRICKALIRGDKTIKAVRLEKMPPPDYFNVDLDDLPYDSAPLRL